MAQVLMLSNEYLVFLFDALLRSLFHFVCLMSPLHWSMSPIVFVDLKSVESFGLLQVCEAFFLLVYIQALSQTICFLTFICCCYLWKERLWLMKGLWQSCQMLAQDQQSLWCCKQTCPTRELHGFDQAPGDPPQHSQAVL